MRFIQLSEQIVNADMILKLQKPRALRTGYGIYATLNSKTPTGDFETIAFNYPTEQEAQNEYERIARQLCAEKE